ncbi:50S ribosomal protein L16 [Candidatus Woesearchaeota archaeon]|nr:50S ribosomal protein L16 [Candidatus Woesearchaeota archaeon]MBW3016804.1 50S ribosomal protein L16 [Candidatus Woesearchaeota archaeon]
MAKLRKACAYRRLERPYTRQSKYKGKSYVRGSPHLFVSQYEMGNKSKKFAFTLRLSSKSSLQLRQNCIESARQACNRDLEGKVGKENFHFKIVIYPFHILRENPLASGAGADRMSTGMQRSFGKTIGRAAQVKEGKDIFVVSVNKEGLLVARAALHKAATKLPTSCRITVNENNVK